MKSLRRIFIILLFLLASCSAPPASTPAPGAQPSVREQAAKWGIRLTTIYHPDGPLYVGDRVSIEVLLPPAFTSSDQAVRVSLGNKELGKTDFGPFGIGGRQQATFYWIWDTRGLESGSHTLTFSVLPAGPTWTEDVLLLPVSDIPAPEPDAHWETAETAYCNIHYVSGTDAARDIETLKTMADAQAVDVERRMGVKFAGKIPLTFLPRVLGQGGFTSSGIYVSYLDQNYAGSTATQVVHHEMVHWLDGQIEAKARLSMLQEGLAVYFSDGHFKIEPIPARAAALIQLDWYIPLRELVDSFYNAQHETGYIEAGALTNYMVKTYGWEKYNAFYRDLNPLGGPNAGVLNAGLKAHFNLSLDQLETNFIAWLHQQTVTENDLTDVRLTISFYDAVRRYQQVLDPSAYFMTAWLPDGDDMRERGIVADYLRHPISTIDRQIESLLVSADASLRAGDYKNAELDIRIVNMLLDVITNTQKK
jgi:hypothetical protein